MKTIYITSLMVLLIFMLTLPLAAKADIKKDTALGDTQQVISPVEKEPKDEKVRVKLSSSGEVVTFSCEDYIFGVVAAEMPALYEEEALKAQAVTAYTYYLRKAGDDNDEYDITDDFSIDQAFITPEKAKEKWGNEANKYEKKIRKAVNAVLYESVTYKGEPASTVYHAISSGKTEKASDIWGGDYPYLVSVDSSFDKLATNYLSTAEFTSEELKKALSGLVTIEDTGKNCFSDIKRTEAGSVKTVTVSGKSLGGGDVRKALGLRSADFDISFSNGKYTFTVRGYGHGIGMSQNGANYLAMQGKTYKEILLHYYPGCEIK